MDTATPSIIIAFLAGLLSFLSPCVLPLVPAYIGYLGGQAVTAPGGRRSPGERFAVSLHALVFGAGFSTVFVTLGLATRWLAQFLRSDWVRSLGGLVTVFFGLVLIAQVIIPRLEGPLPGWLQAAYDFFTTERRVHIRQRSGWRLLSSFLVGISFAAGWTPCIGPVLGSILALSADSETAQQSLLLLMGYSAGLGFPFLFVGLAVDRATILLRRLYRYLPLIQLAAGLFLVALGVLVMMDWLPRIGTWLTDLGIGWESGL
ncbi:MAG: sulfite exporter TauE/SafE family protein [Anaerolineae bacterium]|nr:sulfite exporter TauE/SafE family protein [Anaerolineae bacterium]